MLFGTTDVFLEKLGLDSLDNLPAIAEFIPGADVIELLEHGLRVTPQIEVAPTAVRHADEAQADDTGHDAQADDVEHDEELGDSNESLEDAHEGADAE
jgi:segregation and condensation protein B